MDLNRIRVPFRVRPFRPFLIFTASGQSYHVLGPETMAIDPEESVILLMPGGGEVVMIDAASVTEVTDHFNSPTKVEDQT